MVPSVTATTIDTMFTTLVILVILVAIVLVVILAWAQRSRRKEVADRAARIAAADAPGASLRSLRVADVVGLGGTMWTVEGTLRFDEDGFEWQEHLLVDGNRREWLSVEDDDGALSAWQWSRLNVPGVEPGPAEVTIEGVAYRLKERGSARFVSEGATGAPTAGTAEYADYESDAQRLGFERYTQSGSWEVSTGRRVADHDIDVYPGSDRK